MIELNEASLNKILENVDISKYPKTRNFLNGNVTYLSPFITHGLITIPEIFDFFPSLSIKHKLAYEFAWREFYQHIWENLEDKIFDNIRQPISKVKYQKNLPEDIKESRTGITVIDLSVKKLYENGYLHNHSRMWLASYIVHLRKVHWITGATWMYGHLIDGDLASNSLSWQWIASTFSKKPYLFNSENIKKYAPKSWNVKNDLLNLSYERLNFIANNQITIENKEKINTNILEPKLFSSPQTYTNNKKIPNKTKLMLVHPWMLKKKESFDGYKLGIIHLPFHEKFKWSKNRWHVVISRMKELTDDIFIGNIFDLKKIISRHIQIYTNETLNSGYKEFIKEFCSDAEPIAHKFTKPDKICKSFSEFWKICNKNINNIYD